MSKPKRLTRFERDFYQESRGRFILQPLRIPGGWQINYHNLGEDNVRPSESERLFSAACVDGAFQLDLEYDGNAQAGTWRITLAHSPAPKRERKAETYIWLFVIAKRERHDAVTILEEVLQAVTFLACNLDYLKRWLAEFSESLTED